MAAERSFTGWELETEIKRLLDESPPGKPYCVLCLGDAVGVTSAKGYADIAQALRRVGTYQSTTYDAFQAKCPMHTGQSGTGTFWMIRRQ